MDGCGEEYGHLPQDKYYDASTWKYVLTEGRYPTAADFDPGLVMTVERWHTVSIYDYRDHDAVGVFRMVDGSYVVYTAWTDTTGWGCRDDARFTYHPDRDHAERFGLEDSHRHLFNISLG